MSWLEKKNFAEQTIFSVGFWLALSPAIIYSAGWLENSQDLMKLGFIAFFAYVCLKIHFREMKEDDSP